jgi:hypothetical protein
MVRLLLVIAFLVCSTAWAEDILLEVSAPDKNNPNLLVATYYRNQPDYYYFSVVYRFDRARMITYKTKLSFSLQDASQVHMGLIKWMRKVMSGSRVAIADPIEICPIDPSQLPRSVSQLRGSDDDLRFECSSQ